jgi:NitT/TauT family transport system substrate-binding protein
MSLSSARTFKLALPDLVSNSYFPAIAAVELGMFKQCGLDVSLEMVYPAPACYDALRDCQVDFVAGSAHLPLGAFPGWRGARLLCSLSQGMYWFLVLRKRLRATRGDLSILDGMRIVAAPGVDLGFRALLDAAGIDPVEHNIEIAPLPGGVAAGVSFGVAAARAMEAGKIDGFWANGMAAAVAVDSGAGDIILDVRRGDGPPSAFAFTQPSLACRAELAESDPEIVQAAVGAIMQTQKALREDPSLATRVGQAWFPAQEARLIQGLVERDLDYYHAHIDTAFIDAMQAFAMRIGTLDQALPADMIVDRGCRLLWESPQPS